MFTKKKKKSVQPLQTSSSNYYNYNFLNFGIFEELKFWKFMTLEGDKLFDLLGLLGLGLGDSSVLGFFFSFLFFWNYLMQICLLLFSVVSMCLISKTSILESSDEFSCVASSKKISVVICRFYSFVVL